MKKSIIFLVAGLFVGSAVSFAATVKFFDIPAGSWYQGPALRLADRGIVNGYDDGSFKGDNMISRAEVATMLDRTVQLMESTRNASMTFEDAQSAAKSAAACTKEGTVSSKGSYNPNSSTWWFNIVTTSHPGCYSECVFDEKTKTAEVNWKCTGALPSSN